VAGAGPTLTDRTGGRRRRPAEAWGLSRPTADYIRSGKLAYVDQLATATSFMVLEGPAAGCRALDLRVAGGIDLRILPDRGFDVGQAWFGGLPLAWISAVGETRPLRAPAGMAWLEAFGGGLVTTCGLRTVGSPSEGHGLHGRFSHLSASDVRVERQVVGDEVVMTARATINEVAEAGGHLRVGRTITSRTGHGVVEVTDTTTNQGTEAEPAPILCHVNFGAPLFDEEATLEVDSLEVLPRDEDAGRGVTTWMTPGPPREGASEMLFEHRVRGEGSGWRWAALVNRSVGLRVMVAWRLAALPRFHQWLHPGRSMYVLGWSRRTAPCWAGRPTGAEGVLPVMNPGERRTTRIRITAQPLEGAA
jgi:hypothetical protein